MEADGIRRDGYNASELCDPSRLYVDTPYILIIIIRPYRLIYVHRTRASYDPRRAYSSNFLFFFSPDGAILNIAYTATSSKIDEEKLQLLNAFILYYYFIVCHDGV